MNAYDALAITASVPFTRRMTGHELRQVIETTNVPSHIWSHVERALIEAPIAMIARLLDEKSDFTAAEMLSNIHTVARIVGAETRITQWLNG